MEMARHQISLVCVHCRFLVRLEAGYADPRAVPYHGKPHAAHVLQSMHMLLSTSGLTDGNHVDPVLHLACLLAAVSHTTLHSGVLAKWSALGGCGSVTG